jgi:small subunit ribosomal protein S20
VPNLKSSKKSLRASLRARDRNRGLRTRMRTAIKKVRQTADPAAAAQALQAAASIIDRTAHKGVVHRKTAARYKSRLARAVQAKA